MNFIKSRAPQFVGAAAALVGALLAMLPGSPLLHGFGYAVLSVAAFLGVHVTIPGLAGPGAPVVPIPAPPPPGGGGLIPDVIHDVVGGHADPVKGS